METIDKLTFCQFVDRFVNFIDKFVSFVGKPTIDNWVLESGGTSILSGCQIISGNVTIEIQPSGEVVSGNSMRETVLHFHRSQLAFVYPFTSTHIFLWSSNNSPPLLLSNMAVKLARRQFNPPPPHHCFNLRQWSSSSISSIPSWKSSTIPHSLHPDPSLPPQVFRLWGEVSFRLEEAV